MARWQGFYDELARERYPALLAYAIALTGQRTTAEDLVQEAMVRTFSSPRPLSSAAHAEHYVRRAAVNIFVDDARRAVVASRAAHRLRSADTSPDPTPAWDERDAVTAALLELPPQLRACMVLRYYDDLTLTQIALRLRLSPGTVKRYVHEGGQRMRTALGADPDAPRSAGGTRTGLRRDDARGDTDTDTGTGTGTGTTESVVLIPVVPHKTRR